jgi:PAS domain S-box-containing protein
MVPYPRQVTGYIWEYGLKPSVIAGFFVLVALLWTFPLQHVIAYPFVFLFFGAIIGSAWFGGIIAGSLATGMSFLLITFFFIPPLYSISIARESRSFLAAFVSCAIVITVVSSARKRAEVAIRNARDELETRVQERTAELQRSNLEILERERQLRLLTEAIPQQIWSATISGSIEYCNRDLTDYIGKRAEELEGDAFFGVFHPEDLSLFRRSWEAARTASESFEVQARVRGTNGAYRWFLVRGIPQRTADGEVVRWFGVHIDIEDQQRAQQNLLLAQEDLSRFTRTASLAEMAASIAHELNQPLTALVSDASACRRWLSAEPANVLKAAAAAERVVHDSSRASAVVSRVRSLFSKTDYVRESTDLNRLIVELARLLRDDAIRRGVSIELRLEENLPVLKIDPVQIQQVLLNLATNGMDAMIDNKEARVLKICSAMQGTDEIKVTVQDCGPGFDETIQRRLFEPFFTTKPEGTGMGLAICRSIIEAHDGRIWAARSKEGTLFQFVIR